MNYFYDKYTMMSDTYKNAYFFGANTAAGFRHAYGDIFSEDRLSRLYIIKGGSGTGKNTLIRTVASSLEANGASCEYYLCGSDAGSLDGVIIHTRGGATVGIADGTAPHMIDTVYPGAVSELVDLGRCWDTGVLMRESDSIRSLVNKKRECFTAVYTYLAAAERLTSTAMKVCGPAVDCEKLDGAVARLFKNQKRGSGYSVETRYTAALTMNGAVSLGTFESLAHHRYRILDIAGASKYCFASLLDTARRMSTAVMISPHPSNENMIREMYFPEYGMSFTLADERTDEASSYINMKRFTDTAVISANRQKLRILAGCRAEISQEVIDSLARAGEYHFGIEKIYRGAMDFDKVAAISADMTERIHSLFG